MDPTIILQLASLESAVNSFPVVGIPNSPTHVGKFRGLTGRDPETSTGCSGVSDVLQFEYIPCIIGDTI